METDRQGELEGDSRDGRGQGVDGVQGGANEKNQSAQVGAKRKADSPPGHSCTKVGPPKKARREDP